MLQTGRSRSFSRCAMNQPISVDERLDALFATDEARWGAALARDIRADGLFYYGVRTTGIYCRPVCPARKPKRANVTLYRSCAEAEAAGYRACKVCRPTLAI